MKLYIPLFFVICLQANPSGPTVMGGEASAIEKNNTLEITTSDRAVIHWDSFSIGAGETTRFVQPGIDSAVLNKVMGSEISQINGLLQANGQVYLVNPNGVLIGPDGRIDTAAFMAAALDIKTGEFLNGETIGLEGGNGAIINLGSIDTKSGPVVLIGHRIENEGQIHGGEVTLFAGHSVLFDATGNNLLFIQPDLELEELKVALESDAAPSTLAIGIGNLTDASAIEVIDGEIYLTGSIESPSGEVRLLGKSIHLMDGASIDVSGDFHGGTVLVGGDYQGKNPQIPNADRVYCYPGAQVHADAHINGDGGKIIFWADEGMQFYGKVTARGGAEGGDGGFVEISSPGHYSYHGLTNTLAPNGATGTLLLDPTTLTISTAATTAMFAGMTYTGAAATDNINNTELNNNLALSNVVISTASGGAGFGHIIFNAPVSWSANQLSLNATLNVEFNSTLDISGTAILSLFPPQDLLITNATINFSSTAPFLFLGANGSVVVNNLQINCSSNSDIVFDGFTENCIINNATIVNTGTGTTTFFAGSGIANLQITDTSLTTNGPIAFTVGIGGPATINITNSSFSTLGNSTISFNATTAPALIFLTDSTFSTNGTFNFNVQGAGAMGLTNSSFTSPSDITIAPLGSLFLTETLTFNDPATVTLSSISAKPLVRGSPATIDTTASTLSFPVGVDSSGAGLDLTINAPYGSVSFGGNSALTSLTATAGSNIDVQGIQLEATEGSFYLNAGGSINLSNGSTVQGVSAVTLIAGNHLIGSGTGLIQTVNANDLILVSDNNFLSPTVGSGVFQLSGYTLQTNSGAGGNNIVFLYTSKPTLYISSPITGTLPSNINGLTHTSGFFSGPNYQKGVNEFLYTYYPNLPVDPPSFELIFKTTGISTATVAAIQVAVTEPVSNPPQVAQVTEGNLSTPSTPDPKTPCRTPPVSVQAL